jgi:hypothetical protein
VSSPFADCRTRRFNPPEDTLQTTQRRMFTAAV